MAKQTKILDRQFIPAGQVILREGAGGSHAYLIESGRVEVFARDEGGHDNKIGEAGPGEIIGEMAVITGEARTATIRAVTDCVLVAIAADDMNAAMKKKSGLFKKVIGIIEQRLKKDANPS